MCFVATEVTPLVSTDETCVNETCQAGDGRKATTDVTNASLLGVLSFPREAGTVWGDCCATCGAAEYADTPQGRVRRRRRRRRGEE